MTCHWVYFEVLNEFENMAKKVTAIILFDLKLIKQKFLFILRRKHVPLINYQNFD